MIIMLNLFREAELVYQYDIDINYYRKYLLSFSNIAVKTILQ